MDYLEEQVQILKARIIRVSKGILRTYVFDDNERAVTHHILHNNTARTTEIPGHKRSKRKVHDTIHTLTQNATRNYITKFRTDKML